MDTLINQNTLSIPYQLISNIISLSGDNNINGDWMVFVTDGMDTVMSDDIRNITIDASAVLSLDGTFLPLEFVLHQNYPNPFNPTTQIKYDLPEDMIVTIAIYDVMGRNIRNLMNMSQDAGYHSIQWDAKNDIGEGVAAGMYIYTIQAGEFRATKKMVLLK